MSVQVLLFAGAADIAGTRSVELELDAPVTVHEIHQELERRVPTLQRLLLVSRWAVNHRFVDQQTQVLNDDEVALIPPVSGG